MKLPRPFKSLLLPAIVFGILATAIPGFAERIPPNSMADLTGSEFIVIGRYAKADGKTEFIVSRMIRGDAAAAKERMEGLLKNNIVKAPPEGGLRFIQDGHRFGSFGGSWVDAEQLGVWFLLDDERVNGVERQSPELADGFAALIEGRTPELPFRLLQEVDYDMHRDALEELYAQRNKSVIALLHKTALSGDAALNSIAFRTLTQTKLIEVGQFWGKWTSLPLVHGVAEMLAKEDPDRTLRELQVAISTETSPSQLVSLLYAIPYGSTQKIDLALPHLGHSSAAVRDRVIGNTWDVLWNLNAKSYTSTEAKTELIALGERVIPLLDSRLKVETDTGCKARLTQMLERKDGIPWILRIPRDRLDEPIPPYAEDKELEFLVGRLTSHSDHGFIMETAGSEIAERFFDEGFKRLKSAAASQNYNSDMVYDGMGYVRHPQMFDYLVDHLAKIGPGDSTYGSTFRALGVQNNPASLAAIKRFGNGINEHNARQLDGLAVLEDKEVLAYLKEHEKEIKYHAQIPYLRARAMHGDSWAVDELLSTLQVPPAPKFLTDGFWIPSYIIEALLSVNAPAVTDVLKKEVEKTWPSTSSSDGFAIHWAYLYNYAGSSHRRTALAEIARRDPHWLAALCLRKMADKSLPARSRAASAFQQLTGQLGDYRPEDFAADRVEPLKKLEAWWDAHKTESREQWLTHFFREKGFGIERLDKTALPNLVRALESNFFTHNLAVEQISAICRKYFDDFQHQNSSYQGQQRTNVRVIGWLRARQWID